MNYINKIEDKFIYKCFIAILMFMFMLEGTTWNEFNDSLLHDILLIFCLTLALLLFAKYIIENRYSIKELIIVISLCSMGVICYISSGYTGLFITVLAAVLVPENSLDEVLKLLFYEEVILLVMIIIASQMGVLQNKIIEINKGMYVTEASALGFSHPNMLGAQATSIVFLYLCKARNNLKINNILVVALAITVIYFFSRSRISMLLGVGVVILIALRKIEYIKKFVFSILPWMNIIVITMLIVFMGMYVLLGSDSPVVKMINDMFFNGRIGLAYRSIEVYPITVFGKPLDLSLWNEWQYYSLDNGQVMILIEYGVIGALVYIYMIQSVLKKIKDNREYVFAVVTCAFLFWSMYEGTMFFIGKNFTMLLFSGFMSNKKSQIISDKDEKKVSKSNMKNNIGDNKKSIQTSIPKIIHYCWFGGNPLPEIAVKCINSWKKFFPDYEIKEWNEKNFDLNCCNYVKEAYEAKKWAFVSDYARFWILYNEGGLYFDTDVEVIRDMSAIIEQGPFMGCENLDNNTNKLGIGINPGLGIGAIPYDILYKEILDDYDKSNFIKEDGTYDYTTIVDRTTSILNKYGFKQIQKIQKVLNINIYPKEYFCPMDYATGKIDITENTYSIHWYDASWLNERMQKRRNKNKFIKNHMPGRMGDYIAKIYMTSSYYWEWITTGQFKIIKDKLKAKIRK